jgi:hypothetical protein
VRVQRTINKDPLSGKKRKDKQVIIPKISNTHELETRKGGRCDDTERKREIDGHSRPVDHRATDR